MTKSVLSLEYRKFSDRSFFITFRLDPFLIRYMPTAITDFSYDVFVSYRHKDNLYDQWVTTFVDHLRRELAATLKDEVTVYFDQNASDGLHAFHDVDSSLRDKIKCRIFIPILSHTYCDPRSFAWQNEFTAFCNFAKNDGLGLQIKAGANIASRILPVRIHEMDQEDLQLYEETTGMKLRPIDFIFRSSGVDRPLRVIEEHPGANQNGTIYRDQINQVAMAVKALMTGMQNRQGHAEKKTVSSSEHFTQSGKYKRYAPAAMIVLLVLVAGIYFLNENASSERVSSGMTTPAAIAVLPFSNLAGDKDQEYFSDGITEQLITDLARLQGLKVIARTSVMKFKQTTKSISEIGAELGVTHILEGSVRKDRERIRITAQLISVSDQSHLWAEDFDEPLGEILRIQDAVSKRIARTLNQRLSQADNSSLDVRLLQHPEAYEHYLKGRQMHVNVYLASFQAVHFDQAEAELLHALKLEPRFAPAVAELGSLYDTRSYLDESGVYARKRDSLSNIAHHLNPNAWYSLLLKSYTFAGPKKELADSAYYYLRHAYAVAPNNTTVCEQMAMFLERRGLWRQCIPFLEKSIELDPFSTVAPAWAGYAYAALGDSVQAKRWFQKVIALNPLAVDGYTGMSLVFAYRYKTDEAENYLKKARNIDKDHVYISLVEPMVKAQRGDRSQLNEYPSPEALIIFKEFQQALDLAPLVPDRYEFFRDNPFYNPLKSLGDYERVMAPLREAYEVNKRKYTDRP